MKNNLLIYLTICCFCFVQCKCYEKKIVGSWLFMESQKNLLLPDREKNLFNKTGIESRYDFADPINYFKNKTFLIDNDCYEETGSYSIKFDTLNEIYSSFDGADTIKYTIIKINNKLMILRQKGGDFLYYLKIKTRAD